MTTTQRPSTSGATGHQLPATDLDLGDPAFAADPYPALAALREQGLLVRHSASGMLLATTYAAVTEVLRHRAFGRVWRDREPADAYAAFNLLHRHQMMESEPPEHTRLRRLVAGAFGRGHVERMRPRIAAIADDLLDQVAVAAGDRPVDLISGYAEPLPVAVVADLLGVPAADRPLLRGWSQAIVRMYEYARSAEVERAAVVASAEFAGYVRELATERRREPGEDLLTDLMRARQGGAGLSEDELVASVVLLLNAGHEASVNGFGNGLVDLLRHPDQLATLTSGAVAVETAVEELLRHDPPLQLFERTATAAVDVAGVRVPAGTKVAALLGSPRSARSVGWALHALPACADVPWQRVINSDGRISAGSRGLGAPIQAQLLRDEGVRLDRAGRVDFRRFLWDGNAGG